MSIRRPLRRGFTVVEMLVVLFVILVLAGLLFPALSGALSVGVETKSISRLRQIGVWSNAYTTDNRERVLPSQFDYTESDGYQGTVRSLVATQGEPFEGTWADILWTENGLATFPYRTPSGDPITDDAGVTAEQYLYDSPDANFYENMAELVNWDPGTDDVLRSAAPNSPNPFIDPGDAAPTPYGNGARQDGLPGFFAANGFFNAAAADPDPRTKFGFWSIAQIRAPASSLYLVDSYAGETIQPVGPAFALGEDGRPVLRTEVDPRYGDSVLMLRLDGSVLSRSAWGTIGGLENGVNGEAVRVRNLADRRGAGS